MEAIFRTSQLLIKTHHIQQIGNQSENDDIPEKLYTSFFLGGGGGYTDFSNKLMGVNPFLMFLIT